MHDFIREKILSSGTKEMGFVIEQQIRDRFLPFFTSLEGEVRMVLESQHLPTREHIGRLVKGIQKLSVIIDSDAALTSDLRHLIRKIPGQVALAEEWVELGQFLQIVLDNLQVFGPQKCNYWKPALLSRILFRFTDLNGGPVVET
jgi:hypothetical protein